MQGIFCLYLFCFVCPYLLTLVYDDPYCIVTVQKICMLPQAFLLCIEIVQMYENLTDYVNDPWNWIDLTQIVTFQVLF